MLRDQWKDLAEKHYTPDTVNLLAAHLYMGVRGELLQEEEPEGEKSILHPGGLEMIYTEDLPEGCQYAALGHLHRGFPLSGSQIPAVYSGSPSVYSMNELKGVKSIVLAEINAGKKSTFRFQKLKSPWPLYRETFTDTEEAVSWLKDHPEGYVELIMKTGNYISGSEKTETPPIPSPYPVCNTCCRKQPFFSYGKVRGSPFQAGKRTVQRVLSPLPAGCGTVR